MTKKTKSLMIYVIGGFALVVFGYGLTILRSINDKNSQSQLHSTRQS
jgi:hypothetical protein